MDRRPRSRARRRSRRGLVIAIILMDILILCVSAAVFFNHRDAASDTSAPGVSGSETNTAAGTDTSNTAAATTAFVPTPPITADPTPPPVTDPKDLIVSWETPAVFDGANAFSDQKQTMTGTDGATIDYWVLKNGAPVTGVQAPQPMSFGDAQSYTAIEGVLSFRGNNYRTNPAWGTANVSQKKLEIVWTKDDGAVSTSESYWPGSGWTGQPLLVHWPESTRNAMNISDEMKAKDLVEVIYPVFDGSIYFLDLETGKPTRDPIKVGFTFKGTGFIDPRGYPILYCGQGLNENNGTYGEFNYHIFNLLDQTEMYALYGRDNLAFREWGAWDSSGLLNAQTDTMIECAENGMVYLTKLNTQYDEAAKTLSITPQITRYRYRASYSDELGIENSPAAYKNYLYFCDNGGTFQCLDLNTLTPKWIFNTGDDTDCTTTIEETADGAVLYTANEIDKRASVTKQGADCEIRKLDALTGELLWEYKVPCIYHYYLNGGALATPLVGQNDISDLIIFNICLTGSESDGKLIALDKATGKLVWERNLAAYSWSSPVAILGDDGKTYAVFCDSAGSMHLFDPRTGSDLDVISLGANVESSPAVYNDMIVVGSYAQKIFGIKIS